MDSNTARKEGTQAEWDAARDVIKKYIELTQGDVDERESIYKKRRDFYEGRHHLYSNVVGLRGKERQGHILAVFNYIWRFSTRLTQALANSPMRMKVVPEDEADEIESMRAEAEESFHEKVLHDNHFWDNIFRRNATIQVRDADFAIKTIVEEENGEKKIKIYWAENMEKLHVVWDDAAGTSYSTVIYRDLWTLDKIQREFDGYKAEPINLNNPSNGSQSSHTDPYGVRTTSTANERKSPTGQNKIPKAYVADAWGWFKVLDDKTGKAVWKMCNITMINDDVVQFVKSDYDHNPWIIGHSFDNPGSPWSIGFIDNLIDPQVELNDRMSEEGDMIRIGANQKYVVVNMPNFDASSIKPGSGYVIYVEGENADFKPLEVNVNPFPSETYINRTMDHLFNIGLPKIAISAGSAPYTGRIGVIQYQPVSDLVDELRIKWSPVLAEVIKRVQSYAIKFFPETQGFMKAHDSDTNADYGPVMRKVEFEWDNVLPQSRSDSIVDMATLWDRDLLPFTTAYEMAGFKDPNRIIKQLKKENEDPTLLSLRSKFKELAPGAVEAQLDARKKIAESEEQMGQTMGAIDAVAQQSQPTNKPILQKYQNDGRRGVPATAGVPNVGQTASAQGAAAQVSQNLRAQ